MHTNKDIKAKAQGDLHSKVRERGTTFSAEYLVEKTVTEWQETSKLCEGG